MIASSIVSSEKSAVRQYELQARLGKRYRYGVARHLDGDRRLFTGFAVLLVALGIATIVAVAVR
jgi:hypothetical protein